MIKKLIGILITIGTLVLSVVASFADDYSHP
jgi:hypothetical protein